MKKVYLFLLISLLVGCATTAKYQHGIGQWRGKNIIELQKAWGKPTRTARLSSDNMIYVYERNQLYSTPQTNPTTTDFVKVNGVTTFNASKEAGMANMAQISTRYCRTTFETNSSGTIVNIQFQGNNCVANTVSSIP